MTIMYWTETYSGSLERRFAHVLCYELFTLGNAHILNELIRNELVRNSDLEPVFTAEAAGWSRDFSDRQGKFSQE